MSGILFSFWPASLPEYGLGFSDSEPKNDGMSGFRACVLVVLDDRLQKKRRQWVVDGSEVHGVSCIQNGVFCISLRPPAI
jgi:hypothetical protein